jgi:cell wall-associated NlpC family hydrolase
VKVVYKNEFSIELPDFDLPDVESTKMTEKAFEDSHMLGIWFRAAFPKEGDVIEINIGGHPIHCGIVVSPNSMLHILGGYTARIERYDSTRWSSRINGIYRHKDKCCA